MNLIFGNFSGAIVIVVASLPALEFQIVCHEFPGKGQLGRDHSSDCHRRRRCRSAPVVLHLPRAERIKQIDKLCLDSRHSF